MNERNYTMSINHTNYGQYIVTSYDGSKEVFNSLNNAIRYARKQAIDFQALTGVSCEVDHLYSF